MNIHFYFIKVNTFTTILYHCHKSLSILIFFQFYAMLTAARRNEMKRLLGLLAMILALGASLAGQDIKPYLSVPVPPEDVPASKIFTSLLHANWSRNEVYAVYSQKIVVVNIDDHSTRTIELPVSTGGVSCISPQGLVATMYFPATTAQPATTVQVVDPAGGSPRQFVSRLFRGGISCDFSPVDGLLYLASNVTGPAGQKIVALDPATMQVVKGWDFMSQDYIMSLAATANGVYAIQHGYGTVGLGKIDNNGNYQLINPDLPFAEGGMLHAAPNGYVTAGGTFYAPDGTPTLFRAGGTAISWPSQYPWYAYACYQNSLIGLDITRNTDFLNLAIPNQTYGGVVSRHLGDGTDQAIALRTNGYLDFYKVTPPPEPTTVLDNVTNVMTRDVRSTGLAPGSFGVISGTRLTTFVNASDIFLPVNIASEIPFPTRLAGTQVRICDKSAPLYFAWTRGAAENKSQINFIVPQLPPGFCPVVVEPLNAGQTAAETTSNQVTLKISPVSPAFLGDFSGGVPVFLQNLTQDSSGRTFVAQTTNVTANGRSTAPARPGDVIMLWPTGLGATTPPVTPGNIPPVGTLAYVNAPVAATMKHPDGTTLDVKVIYATHSPQFSGLYQLPVQIPAEAKSGQATLLITVGNVTADPITVYIQ
jgi:uncharacterized protein (TIGR03437 family)